MNFDICEISEYEKGRTFLKKCKRPMQVNLFQVLSSTGEVGCREESLSCLDKYYQSFLNYV